jgi:hypothetical protein
LQLLAVLREEKVLELWVPEAFDPYIWRHTQNYAPGQYLMSHTYTYT